MTLIGLTGGIAAGKSIIGRRLEELGAVRIDADQLARDAVEVGTDGLARIQERFGPDVILPDGSLDRAALGARVFGDEEGLARLNTIVHPAVRELAQRHIDAARTEKPAAVIVYEVPLLVEADVQMPWEHVIVADAPAEARVQRLITLRNMEEEAARRRVASQASDAERLAVADTVIDTSGTEAETLTQVDALWERLTGRTNRDHLF